jgi:hypothetical protein
VPHKKGESRGSHANATRTLVEEHGQKRMTN